MKKITLFFISLFLMSAVNIFAGSLDYLRSGEYAFYIDTRGGEEFLRGYLYFRLAENGGVFFNKNVRIEDNAEISYMITVDSTEDELKITNIEVMKNDASLNDSNPTFQQGIVDMMNFHEFYLVSKDKINIEAKCEDKWPEFGYSLFYHYNIFYPMFRFNEITKDAQKTPCYKLNYAGRFNSIDDARTFFDMSQVSFADIEVSREVENLSIPKAKTKKISLNDIDITFDENWEEAELEGNPSYWVKLTSIRDSQIIVEAFPDEILNLETWESLIRIMMLINLTDYNSIVCEQKKDFLQVSFALYDENGYKNYQYMIIPDKKDNKLVNFSTFADIFDANKAYYKKILKSIKKTK